MRPEILNPLFAEVEALLDRAGQHRVRGDLDEGALPTVDERRDRLVEQHRGAQVGRPVRGVERCAVHLPGRDRGDHGYVRRARREVSERVAERAEQRIHLRAVGREVNLVQQLAEQPVRLEALHDAGQCGDLAGEHGRGRTVARRDPDLRFPGPGEGLLRLVERQPDDGHAAAPDCGTDVARA